MDIYYGESATPNERKQKKRNHKRINWKDGPRKAKNKFLLYNILAFGLGQVLNLTNPKLPHMYMYNRNDNTGPF